MAEETKDYRQPLILTGLLQVLIIFQIFSAMLVGAVLALAIMRGESVKMPAEIFTPYTFVRRSLYITPLMITVVKMFWVYRINKNTHQITSKKMEFSPGWAVGWHFIPFAALWLPYLIYCELYLANRDPENWKTQKPPLIILIWWIMTIISGISGVITSIVSKNSGDPPLTVSMVLLLGLALHQTMALYIYSRIASFQRRAHTPSQIEQVF